MAEPRVAVVVVSYETRALTLEAVASARRSRGVEVECWVVDNASTDGSVEALRHAYPEARVVALEENVGFGAANNVALDGIEAPWILLLNSDATLPDPGALAALVETARAHPRAAVVGPRLEDPDGRLQHSVHAFPSPAAELVRAFSLHRWLAHERRGRLLGSEFADYGRPGPVGWLAGACLLVRRSAVVEVGGFDPAIFMYGEELEWMWRLRDAGWEVRYEPGVTARHLRRGSSSGSGGWTRLAAMAGDAYAVRRRKGWPYLAAFSAARVVRLTVQPLVQALAGAASGDRYRLRRARELVRDLRAWVAALARGAATHPGAPAFLPPGHSGHSGRRGDA